MRGEDREQVTMFSYVSPDARVPADHPLRVVRPMVQAVLEKMSSLFDGMYAKDGRPSIPPERLLRAMILQMLYSVRSERQLMEQLDYNLLFRWFVGLNADEPVWDASTFSQNRDRLLDGEVARLFLAHVVEDARVHGLLSAEHFTVDGTLIEAWASQKTFRPKDERPEDRPPPEDPGNPTVNFHGERRSNATHRSTTDPDALLARKSRGEPAKLSYRGHVLMENRHGLVVAAEVTTATGTAEREAALAMVRMIGTKRRATLGADKGYDTKDFVAQCRAVGITPHVAQNTSHRRSAIDARTTRHPGYAISQRLRKQIEEVFGWMKTVAGWRRTRHRGQPRVGWQFLLTAAVYDLLRMRRLLTAPT